MYKLSPKERRYINLFFKRNGNVEVKKVNTKEKCCIVSIPVVDSQEDTENNQKVIQIPIPYDFDEDGAEIYNFPKFLTEEDKIDILDEIERVIFN